MTTRVAIVLHAHQPYVRRNGVWPCGEDWFHQAATESYLPLLGVFSRLRERGVRDIATLGITPLLANQMQDAQMLAELTSYLGRYELRAMRQAANWRGPDRNRVVDLAAFYARFGREQLLRLPTDGLARGFASLQDVIEIAGGPASHPLLPLITEPSLVAMQLEVGIREHERIFGNRPASMWLPECAVAPGLEEALAAAGVARAVVDESAIGSSQPARVGAVTAIPRDAGVARMVWSPTGGLPSNEWYRDFHNYDMEAGFKNWRVTGPDVPVLAKAFYEPERALAQLPSDVDRFISALEQSSGDPIVVCFDAELFGHWWFEGPAWLESVLTRLSEHPSLRPVTLSMIEPSTQAATFAASTWGEGGDFRSWVSDETAEMWRALAEAEAETVALLKDHTGPLADQLLRELFLAESSDWPWHVVRGTVADYARSRFWTHLDRRRTLAAALGTDAPEIILAREINATDNPFESVGGPHG